MTDSKKAYRIGAVRFFLCRFLLCYPCRLPPQASQNRPGFTVLPQKGQVTMDRPFPARTPAALGMFCPAGCWP